MCQTTIQQTDTRDNHVDEERADHKVNIAKLQLVDDGVISFVIVLLELKTCILGIDINLQRVTSSGLGRVELRLGVRCE